MAKLIYVVLASLDGYIADENGNFDWAAPDEEVHAFVNDLDRPLGTYLYGRRMYELMAGWETDSALADQSGVMREFAELWKAADKIVYTRTLDRVPPGRSPPGSRAARRAPLRQRSGLPPLPHQDLRPRWRAVRRPPASSAPRVRSRSSAFS